MVLHHVLLVCFLGQGNINPFLRFAKRLAFKGIRVTFSSVDSALHHMRSAASDSSAAAAISPSFAPLGQGHLRFDSFSDGWDVDDPRRRSIHDFMAQLGSPFPRASFADLVRRQADQGFPVTCVVGNPFMPWIVDVASDMGIPAAVLWVQSSVVFSLYYHYHHRLSPFPTAEDPDIAVQLPGMPLLQPEDIPSFLLPTNIYECLTSSILGQFENLSKATWVLVNSYEELEADVIQSVAPYAKLIPVGPLVELLDELMPSQKQIITSSQNIVALIKGDAIRASVDCLKWLDRQDPRSVVYVSVGSIVIMSREDMEEMARGLSDCGKSFLWVVRDESRDLLPIGFEEETKEKGLVVNWSPQDRVLTHPAVAVFVTHCGWNSTLECLVYGVPVITFPHWGDQTTDAKFLVDVYGVGAHLTKPPPPSKKVASSSSGSTSNAATTGGPASSFTREDLVWAVDEVLEGPRAEEVKANVLRWKEAARKAVEKDGSSDRNIEAFVQEIRGMVPPPLVL